MKRDHALELEPIEAMNGAVEANGNFRNDDTEGPALSQAALDGMAETNGAKPEPSQGVGRLSRPPNPVLFRLLYEKQSERDLVEVLPHLLRIDAAHVVMLAHTNLLRPKVAAELLRVNRELGRLMKLGKEAFPTRPQHRGFYFLYEQEYIDRL